MGSVERVAMPLSTTASASCSSDWLMLNFTGSSFPYVRRCSMIDGSCSVVIYLQCFSFNNRFLNSSNNKRGGNVENSQNPMSFLKSNSTSNVGCLFSQSTMIIDYIIFPLEFDGFRHVLRCLSPCFPDSFKMPGQPGCFT